MRKAECTPEEWNAHLAKVRAYRNANVEHWRQVRREYQRRPEVKARKKLYDARPEQVARRRALAQRPQEKEKANQRRLRRWKQILANQRRRRTGFTPELVAKLTSLQRGKCAICRRAFTPTEKICADHCHETKRPRGLLCHDCNVMDGLLAKIGLAPRVFLERLTQYLASPPAQSIKLPSPP